MPVYIQVWGAAGNGRVTDMANAGRRGKTCRVFTFTGDCEAVIHHLSTTPEQRAAREAWSMHPVHEFRDDDYDTLVAELRRLAVPPTNEIDGTRLDEREVRAVDAPKPKLTASGSVVGSDGVARRWSAEADHDGVTLRELDDHNEWTEITPSKQSNSRAYALAAKVWDRVKAAPSLYAAANILRESGCKLHGFCGLD